LKEEEEMKTWWMEVGERKDEEERKEGRKNVVY